MMGRAVQPAQQIPQRHLERAIAVGTTQTATLPKVLERSPAAGAGLTGPRSGSLLRQLLPHGGEECPQRCLGRRPRTLHALLGRAALAEMQGGDLLVDDLSEV